VHQITELAWRLPAYAVVMAVVIALWARLRGGGHIVRMLAQSRTHAVPAK